MSDCLSLRERYFAPGLENLDAPEWIQHLQECPTCRLAHEGLPLADRALGMKWRNCRWPYLRSTSSPKRPKAPRAISAVGKLFAVLFPSFIRG
jgi:hypothetical protein